MTTTTTLRCASMRTGPCSEPVSRIDRKGYVYCGQCGVRRASTGIACRALRPAEAARLERGEPLRRY